MKYSKGFKSSIVRRVVENGSKSVYQVSKETEMFLAKRHTIPAVVPRKT
nr:hypothetical protein [uncultured Sphaerochaeta sp.]